MFNVLMNIIVGYYSGMDGKGNIPTWAIVLSAFLYPMYHIFDLLDGKHARKTGQSSPLGLLVDHGCDALTIFPLHNVFGINRKIRRRFHVHSYLVNGSAHFLPLYMGGVVVFIDLKNFK